MKVLLTGLSGNAGVPLARALARAEGITRVYGLYRKEASLASVKQRLGADLPIELVKWDLREPMDGLAFEVDAVVHAAALRGPQRCDEDPKGALNSNVLGSLHLADFALRNGAKAFLFFSIQSVYDRACSIPISEEAPTSGEEMYQITKLAAEMALQARLGARLDLHVLRLSHIYGFEDGKGFDGILGAFLKEVPAGRLRIDGDGTQTVCFLHIQDLCDLVLRLLRRPPAPGIYNLCSETLSVEELAHTVCEASQRRFGETPSIWRPDPQGRIPRSFGLDLTKLLQATGWEPSHRLQSVVDGLLARSVR